MPKVWVNGHYFKGRGDVDFGQPSAATRDFDQRNGLVNVVVMERKFFERNEAVDARERGIVWWWQINYEAFFTWKFSSSYADGANSENIKGRNGKGPIMKFASISFLIRISTVSGSVRADWRLGQMRLWVGRFLTPGWKPMWETWYDIIKKWGSGWWSSSADKRKTFTGVDKYFLAFLFAAFLTGHIKRAWAPPQKLQTCMNRQRCLEHLPVLKLMQTWLSEEDGRWRREGGGGLDDTCGMLGT